MKIKTNRRSRYTKLAIVVSIKNTTEKIAKDQKVYVALSGDEVALTNIRITGTGDTK